ncbi:MAG: hypothetical protein OXH61_07980 [Acidimicrobiaceae bacterium]|nr:hypothetical protein [Acidimicrobiaceae bacterium]
MTHDLSDFEQQLGQELRTAAYRQIEARNTKTAARRLYPIFAGAVATIAVVAMAAFVLAYIRPQPVSAHPFKIVHLEHEIRLEIVDLVKDALAAGQELRRELGIDIEFAAVPAPPELLNEVLGASSSGTTTATVIFDETGRSEQIILPREIDGKLTIQYGREAHLGERYLYTATSPICRDLWAQTPHESTERINALADSVRYDTIDSDYNSRTDVPLRAIDPTYRLIDTLFLSQDELLVVYAAHLEALGANRPNCGWSAP